MGVVADAEKTALENDEQCRKFANPNNDPACAREMVMNIFQHSAS